MLIKVVLTTAWAEEVGFSDADIASVLDIGSDAPDSPAAVCPQCRRQPVECAINFFKYDSTAETAESIPGRGFVKCVCGTQYSYAVADKMDGQTPVDQSRIPAAVVATAPKSVAPPVSSWAAPVYADEPVTPDRIMDSNDVVLARYRHQSLHPAFYQQNVSAAVIWAAVEAQRRAVAATTAPLRQNPATD